MLLDGQYVASPSHHYQRFQFLSVSNTQTVYVIENHANESHTQSQAPKLKRENVVSLDEHKDK